MAKDKKSVKILPRDKDPHPPTTAGARTRELASGSRKPAKKPAKKHAKSK